ncbi:MAG: zonular occludens toxin domain-containing protein [Rhodanobacter sp.]
MLVFNEGLPRSGKSYDAVKNHILVALTAGRIVFARINGLNHEEIARYLIMDIERVRELLQVVSTAEAKTLFLAQRDLTSVEQNWYIEDRLKNALFVIDEAHEFYVASREAINPAVEQFFALCGQNGMDGVLMSQWYKRLHSSVRARVERKNVFQKLTAAGMQSKYTLKQYHATEPDRFELVDTTIGTYDPKMFPLYHGYAPGATNTEVYTAGGTTVWRRLRKYSLIVVPLLGLAIYFLSRFFHGDGGLVRHDVPQAPLARASAAPAAPLAAATGASQPSVIEHARFDEKGMSAEVRYIFDLSSQARPRLAGVGHVANGEDFGIIEWRQDQGPAIDRMTLAQVRDLGVKVEVHTYGVKLTWNQQAIVVTSWPLEEAASSAQQAKPDDSTASSAPRMSDSKSQEQGGSAWKSPSTSTAYVPPELMPHEAQSTFTMQ